MKKIFPITLLLLVLSLSSQAQKFIASFGIQQSWGVPGDVSHIVYDNYYDYDWVHASRTSDHGRLFYNVLLQRAGLFVELRIDSYGHVIQRQYLDYYPLQEHICNGFCGYHTNYYYSHSNNCYSHNHYGHNHVVYVRPPQQVVHIYPKTTHVVYKNSTSYSYNKPARTVVVDKQSRGNRTQNNLERRGRYVETPGRGKAQSRDNKKVRNHEQTQASGRSVSSTTSRRGR